MPAPKPADFPKMAHVKNPSRETVFNTDIMKRRMRRWWWTAVMVCVFVLSGGFSILNYGWQNQEALQRISQTLLITAYVLALLRMGLPLNYHPRKNILYTDLGLATWLTIIRAMLVALLAGYLFQPWPQSHAFPGQPSWSPGIIYIAASILDYLDGLVARISRHESRLGAYLDINIDALGLLVAPLVAVWYGQLPIAYLSVSAAYYLFVIGIRLRKIFSKPVFELKPYPAARVIAGFQMGLVGIALLPVFSPPTTRLAAYIFMVPLLAGFLKDWCFVCGYIKSDHGRNEPRRYSLKSFFTQ
jgi:CDP-diacylglycerol--glycerol-3-phosphate 3-phosphatidyltransferase